MLIDMKQFKSYGKSWLVSEIKARSLLTSCMLLKSAELSVDFPMLAALSIDGAVAL